MSATTSPVLTALATVRLVGVEQHDALLARATERAPDPSIFTDHPPVFFATEASNGNRDTYYSRMMPSSLRNYAADATAGVAFQDSHKRDSIARTLGMTLAGKYTSGRGDKPHRTLIDVYTLTGIDPTIDQFIQRMRGGLARDVSIGFYDGTTRCSLCGGNMYDWWSDSPQRCTHIAGVMYPALDAQGKPTDERVMAEALIEDAHLAELSTVFDGATPGAGIIGIKARQLADAGLLLPQVRSSLEERYELRLPGGTVWAGVTLPEERMSGNLTVPANSQTVPLTTTVPLAPERSAGETPAAPAPAPASPSPVEQALDGVRTLLREAGAPEGVELVTSLRALVTERNDLRAQLADATAEATRLRPLADDGLTYRNTLISEALTMGVRAFGDEYEREQDEAELRAIGIAGIKRRIAAYAKAAGEALPSGRATTDPDLPGGPLTVVKRTVPDATYRA